MLNKLKQVEYSWACQFVAIILKFVAVINFFFEIKIYLVNSDSLVYNYINTIYHLFIVMKSSLSDHFIKKDHIYFNIRLALAQFCQF